MAYNSKYTGEQVEELLDKVEGKQDKLTAGSNISIVGNVISAVTSACKCSMSFLGDVFTCLVSALSGKSIAYKLVNGDGGTSLYTTDGTTGTLAAGASVSGTCDEFAISQATNLAEVEYVGDVTLQWQVSSSTKQNTIERIVWVCSSDYSYSMHYLFSELRVLESISIVGGKPTTMKDWFFYCQTLTDINLQIDTSAVTDMIEMFALCTSLTNVDGLANWNTASVTTMATMFYGCSNLTNVDGLANWNTASVTSMESTFYSCSNLTNVDGLANWNTASVTSMAEMFYGCSNLTNVDGLANWNMSKVTQTAMMFCLCTFEKITLNWDLSSVKAFAGMFVSCYNLTTIEGSLTGIGADIEFSDSPLTRESALVVINGLKDDVSATLTLSSTTMALLTDEDIKIATDKGWTITA